MGRKSQICNFCGQHTSAYLKHVELEHPDIFLEQEKLVVKMWREGLSSSKISEIDNIIFSGGTSVRRILNKYLSSEELEMGRKQMISAEIKHAYESGDRDWISEKNIERVKSDEGRNKNSEGLKRAYLNGRKTSWNAGKTRETSDVIFMASKKISSTMRSKANSGELKTLLKSGEQNPRWQHDRGAVARRWRNNLDFSKAERDFILARAGERCQVCGITKSHLSIEKDLLKLKKLGLECDHIIPISQGGGRCVDTNSMLLCSRCHMIKTGIEINNKDYRDKYIYDPIMVLSKMLGGEPSLDNFYYKIDDLKIYVIPLNEKFAKNKWLLSEFQDGNSIIFFSDEWYSKRDICLSMIKNRIHNIDNKIFARKCSVIESSSSNISEFFNHNHIAGHTRCKISFSLIYNNEIVSSLSIRRPFAKSGNSYEIARFCSMRNTVVSGAFSRLLKYAKKWCKENGAEELLTYADLRFGSGQTYINNGFEYNGNTGLDFYYTNGIKRFNRFKFRANGTMSEREVAEQNNVYRIYGCGSNRFTMRL